MLDTIERSVEQDTLIAPIELVEQFARVVDVASSRLKNEGNSDNPNWNQLYLHDTETSRIYHLIDVGVNSNTYSNHHGLFVYGIQLDEKGQPVNELIGIQIPREKEAVSQETLILQKAAIPSDVERLAVEVERADKVESDLWDQSLNQLRRNYIAPPKMSDGQSIGSQVSSKDAPKNTPEAHVDRFLEELSELPESSTTWRIVVKDLAFYMRDSGIINDLIQAQKEVGSVALKARFLYELIQHNHVLISSLTPEDIKAFMSYKLFKDELIPTKL